MAKKRGFSSSEEHDNLIIENWNKTVTKNDTVWILGDITMEKTSPYPLLNQLKGIKNVVLGNHDEPQHVPELLKYVNKVCGCVKLKDCILTHIPIHISEINRFKYNVHAHIHDKVIDHDKYINVCAEQINYKPILLNELIC
jgi:calcineurin-like phosphoesterase family protein